MQLSFWLALAFARCASTVYSVPDSEYFTDRYFLTKNTIQLVESHSEARELPAAEQYSKNCATAAAKARERFRTLFPQARDNGRELSAHFGRNAACTVRMAFQLPP